jgi:hypothetical protein
MLSSARPRKPHSHPCSNHEIGCIHRWVCDGQPDEDGTCDEAAKWGERECPECRESRCEECGSIVRLEGHYKPCVNDPNYDPTPWALPGDGASTGPESRAAEAWNIKRGR